LGFSQIWPHRDNDFANKMNAMPKLVVSNSRRQVNVWNNSSLLQAGVAEEVERRKPLELKLDRVQQSGAAALLVYEAVQTQTGPRSLRPCPKSSSQSPRRRG
jgi:hypothetical protein